MSFISSAIRRRNRYTTLGQPEEGSTSYHLDLRNPSITGSKVKGGAHFRSMTVESNRQFKEKHLTRLIKESPELEELSISFTYLKGDGFMLLKDLHAFKILHCSNVSLENISRVLKQSPNLEVLHFNEAASHLLDLLYGEVKTALKEIRVNKEPVNQVKVRGLIENSPLLEVIQMSFINLADGLANAFQSPSLTNLTFVDLSNCRGFYDVHLQALLQNNSKLETLIVEGTAITGEAFLMVEPDGFQVLKMVHLSRCEKLQNEPVRQMMINGKGLTHIFMEQTRLTQAAFQGLPSDFLSRIEEIRPSMFVEWIT